MAVIGETLAKQLTNDKLVKGVIQTIVTSSDLLSVLPFQSIQGDGLRYNREGITGLPTATFFDREDAWTQSVAVRTEHTAVLKILGGDVDISEFDRLVYSDQNDAVAIQVAEMAKSIARAFESAFVYGGVTGSTKEFTGLHVHTPNQAASDATDRAISAAGAALSLDALDQMIDKVLPGRPDYLMMNRAILRCINRFYRDNASAPQVKGEDGRALYDYAGVPILVNDFITMTETAGGSPEDVTKSTDSNTSSIFACKFGPKEFFAIQNQSGITKENLGTLETKDAKRWRLRWYCGTALLSILATAKVYNIVDLKATV